MTYEDAMQAPDQESADRILNELCRQWMIEKKCGPAQAAREIRRTLGYRAGYYDDEVRERVERLFECEHPFFGKISEVGPPTTEEALILGIRYGQGSRYTLKQLREESNGPRETDDL